MAVGAVTAQAWRRFAAGAHLISSLKTHWHGPRVCVCVRETDTHTQTHTEYIAARIG